MRCKVTCLFSFLLSVCFSTLSLTAQDVSKLEAPDGFAKQVDFRSIGPANMMGRITALAVYEKDPCIWWAASASGGLLKTTNNGIDFEHQFDKEATVSIGDVQVAQSDPNIVWVGTGEGNPRNSVSWGDGVYKSTDGGKTWKNMGLEKTFQTGALAIHPEDPNVVFVGSLGRLWGPNKERGLFKTIDGGKTWKKVFYVNDKTGIIDVQLNPANPDELLVATYERQRDGFDGNDPEKKYGAGSGIYKSKDGGKSFTRISRGLPKCKLGRIGLDYYRKNPKYVFAILESEMIAKEPEDAPFMGIRGENADVGSRITSITSDSPAEKAGLKKDDIVVSVEGAIVHSYQDMLGEVRKHRAGDKIDMVVSRDRKQVDIELELANKPKPKPRKSSNGRTRTRRTPFTGTLGGQAANLQEQQGTDGYQYGGVYMSKDGGDSWERINSLNPRPMYYSHIRVDPTDRKNIYVCGTSLYKSKDGGKTFTGDGGSDGIHVDHHALWIDPRDSRHMILGNDGGIYVTYDRMKHWDHHNHVAIGQFYHVGVDAELNYRVYGGLQDNGSWGGPSRSVDGGGIKNTDWFRVGGGDGFITMADPDDADQIYFESQNGGTGRINLRTGERGFIRPRPPRGTRYRFNWKTPFVLSPHNSKVYYSAGNHVFRSFNKGDKIKSISPEITNTDKGAGSALSESPAEAGVIYVGTTDGAVWMTKDGGQNWNPLFHKPEKKKEEKKDDAKKEADKDAKSESAEKQKENTTDEKTESEKPSAKTSDEEKAEPDKKDPVTGNWEGRMVSDRIPPERGQFSLNLKLTEGTKVSGKLENGRGDILDFEGGTFNAETGEISWVVEGQRGEREFAGKISGNEMTGEMTVGGGRFQIDFEAEKKKSEPTTKDDPANQLTRSATTFATNSSVAILMLQAPKTDDGISGSWKAVLEGDDVPGGQIEVTLEVKANDKGELSGALISPFGESPIEEGKYDKETKSLNLTATDEENGFDIEIDGKIKGETLEGTLNVNGQLEVDFSATREKVAQPAEAEATEPEPAMAENASKEGSDEAKPSETTTDEDKSKDDAVAEETDEPAADDPVSGEWEGQFESPRGESSFTLSLSRGADNKVKGSYETERSDGDFTEGTFDPKTGKLSLMADTGNFTLDWIGEVKEGKFSGEIDFNGGQFSMDFEASRTRKGKSQASAAKPKEAASEKKATTESKNGSNLSSLLPGPRWVSSIEASRHKASRAYITFDGHRSNDDGVYLFVTEDYGKTWKSIKGNLPNKAGSARVLREDVVNENLLYLGCEFSCWFSLDRGQTWNRFEDMPTVAVHEIAVHPKAGDIVLGTHGRSLWIADIATLRQFTNQRMGEPFYLFKPKDVVRWRRTQTRGNNGHREFEGEDPKSGTTIAYSLTKRARSVDLFVSDIKGSVVKRFDSIESGKGVHSVVWDLRRNSQGRGRGASLPAGTYQVHLRVDGELKTQIVKILPDPHFEGAPVVELDELEFWLEIFGAE